MSNDFRLGTLEQLIDFRNGKAIKKTDGGIPIYGGNGVLGYSDKSNYENTLIIGRVGAYCGSVHIKNDKCWVSDNAIAGLPKNGYNNEYNYYLLKSLRLNEQRIGSSQPLLTQGILNNIQVKIQFNPKQQKKIAAVLATLDAKIACNNRINAELEAMAKTLYNYWFVQFDFPFDFAQGRPDANGKPYKFSGGKMVYNSTLKREIPAGWKAMQLNELLQSRTDSITASKVDSGAPYTPIDALPMKKMSFGAAQSSSEANTSLIQYKENDILIGAMRVYFHRVCIAPFDGITRTTIIVLRPNEPNHLPYLYQLCNEDRTINVASKISVGTQQPYVNWESALESHAIPYPENDALVQKYSSMMLSVTKGVINREKENAELAKLRDWLLPMLMNGQVTVA